MSYLIKITNRHTGGHYTEEVTLLGLIFNRVLLLGDAKIEILAKRSRR